MRIAIKEIDKPVQIIETSEKWREECTRKYIGDKAEYVYLNNNGTFALAVDEAGLLKELPTNFLLQTSSPYFPIQKMVGTVVFIRTKPVEGLGEIYDYEIDDLKEVDISRIERLIDERYQTQLKKVFEDYGKGCAVMRKIF